MNKDNSSWIIRRKLPKRIVDIIEEESYKVPWYFFKDCAFLYDDAKRKNLPMHPYFSHSLSAMPPSYKHLDNPKNYPTACSDHYKFFPMDFISEFVFRKNKCMLRSHITFQFPAKHKFGKPHNAHVDQEFPHDVVLYYINDADGDTFFFDKDKNIIHRETPERGKLVIFDGSTFHSSSAPSTNIRMTLNINYERT